MRGNKNELKIDIGIITIKSEEYLAVTSRLESLGKCSILNKEKHQYFHQSITDINGLQHNVAVARCLEAGTGNAQSLATDMVEELNPTWLFLVGIAGGVPAPEYSLGDVLLCTRLHDFSISCIHEEAQPTFAMSGGPMHHSTEKLLEILPAYESFLEAQGWNSLEGLHEERPTIDFDSLSLTENLYGDESWNHKVVDSLRRNFLEPRKPKYYLGPIASSDRLVKSVSLAKTLQITMRGITAFEMELGGVYRAAEKKNTPVLTIRSLSDIIGYNRSPEWTQFACESAASFAICLIESGVLVTCTTPDDLSRETISLTSSVKTQITQKSAIVSLSQKSPFHPHGTIPLNDQSYVIRDSDKKLKKHLDSDSFICLHGDFCSGKTSLLIRVPDMLSGGWSIFQPSIEFYSTGRKGTLEKSFFAEIQRKNQDIRDWVSMSEFLKGTRGLFLIDEIGKCAPQDSSIFIDKLFSLVDHVSCDNIRVVLTTKKPLDLFIQSIGLKNPKYYNRWEKVELTEFSKSELIKLLALFPQPIESVLQDNIDVIQRCTLMKPESVQKFCDDLWRYFGNKELPIEEIDQKVKDYLQNLKKV